MTRYFLMVLVILWIPTASSAGIHNVYIGESHQSITLRANNVSLADVTTAISNKTGIQFHISSAVLNDRITVNLMGPDWQSVVVQLLEPYNLVELWNTPLSSTQIHILLQAGTASSGNQLSSVTSVTEPSSVQTTDSLVSTSGTLSSTPLKNYLLNPDFMIWQINTTFTPNSGEGIHVADMWRLDSCNHSSGSGMVISRQEFIPGTPGDPTGNPQYYLRMDRSGVTPISHTALGQRIEGVRSTAGKTMTFSFWTRASEPLGVAVGIKQNFGFFGSPEVDTGMQWAELTTSWQKFTFTFTLGGLAGKNISSLGGFVAARIEWAPHEGTNAIVDIARAQLVEGPSESPWVDKTFAEYLREVQRYIIKSFPYNTPISYGRGGAGAVHRRVSLPGEVNQAVYIQFPVAMYKRGGIKFFNPVNSNARWYNSADGADSGPATTMNEGTSGFALNHKQVAGDGSGELVAIHWAKVLAIGN